MFGRLYFICCVLLLAGCVNDMSEVEQTAALADPGIEKGKDVVLYYSEDGMVKMCIQATTLWRYLTDDPYVEFKDGMKVEFFNDEEKVISTLTSGYGIRYEKQLKTIVRDQVVVINENQEKLETEELVWDEKKHIIFTDKYVSITTADEVLYGTGLEADETMTEYTILHPEGIIKIDMDDAQTDEDL
ncbi:MAG: LPS export ABC transporter periplasmic protein LptC [Chitinophagales bacterium]|nr:LPS export ABC transporter periplasmic protein LptC [Chitinophagales bacterium]HAE13350.1 LPS export ABC transporter periplasmic protein LptC [Bacteroidota bacterium]MCB9019712.1 LPS export ABC transporter periplasmic protein LptC [Chitinophagales bacterium]MCB9022123.1 LPS export ABC transporter periplasmic protein LptC [Chitinophagales bacterium]MCB9031977.1 LPS export ABC transporter periplasmic protein LptC [Chitinophagales bacterium]